MVRVVVQGGAGRIVNDGETFLSSSARLAGTFSSRYIKSGDDDDWGGAARSHPL